MSVNAYHQYIRGRHGLEQDLRRVPHDDLLGDLHVPTQPGVDAGERGGWA